MDVCDGCCRTVPSIVVDEETSWDKNDLCKEVFNGRKDAARIPLFVAVFIGVDAVVFLLSVNRPPNGEREGGEEEEEEEEEEEGVVDADDDDSLMTMRFPSSPFRILVATKKRQIRRVHLSRMTTRRSQRKRESGI